MSSPQPGVYSKRVKPVFLGFVIEPGECLSTRRSEGYSGIIEGECGSVHANRAGVNGSELGVFKHVIIALHI